MANAILWARWRFVNALSCVGAVAIELAPNLDFRRRQQKITALKV